MSEIEPWLVRQAVRSRDEVQLAWSPDTICPGYEWNPLNRAIGQCGVTRDMFGVRLEKMQRGMTFLAQMFRNGVEVTMPDGEQIDITGHVGGYDEENVEFIKECISWLAEQTMVCEYGHAIEQEHGRKLDDHCWMRVVGKHETIVELTLDQFDTEDQRFDAILIQPADARDARVTYHPKRSEIFGMHDTSQRRAAERFAVLDRFKQFITDQPARYDFGIAGQPSITINQNYRPPSALYRATPEYMEEFFRYLNVVQPLLTLNAPLPPKGYKRPTAGGAG